MGHLARKGFSFNLRKLEGDYFTLLQNIQKHFIKDGMCFQCLYKLNISISDMRLVQSDLNCAIRSEYTPDLISSIRAA